MMMMMMMMDITISSFLIHCIYHCIHRGTVTISGEMQACQGHRCRDGDVAG